MFEPSTSIPTNRPLLCNDVMPRMLVTGQRIISGSEVDGSGASPEPTFGPQPAPDDYRIFKGTPSEFFDKAAADLEAHDVIAEREARAREAKQARRFATEYAEELDLA